MLAIVSWQCECGMNVKAMYQTDDATAVLKVYLRSDARAFADTHNLVGFDSPGCLLSAKRTDDRNGDGVLQAYGGRLWPGQHAGAQVLHGCRQT